MFASPSPHVRRANHLEHATRCCIRPRDCRHRDAALRYRAPTSRICIAATAAGMVPRSGAAVLAHVSGQLGHACRRCSRPRVPLDTRNSCRRASRHAAVAQLAFGVLLPRTSTARRCLHAPAVRRRAREPGRLRLPRYLRCGLSITLRRKSLAARTDIGRCELLRSSWILVHVHEE